MAIRHRKDDLLALRDQKNLNQAIQSATLLVFRKMAQEGELEDHIISTHAVLFDIWKDNESYEEGYIRRCPKDGEVYRLIRRPNSAVRSSMNAPSEAIDNWRLISK